MKINFKKIFHPVVNFIDWYIANYHSENFIHRDMIRDEIYRRLKEQEERLAMEHKKAIEILRNQYELEYQIKEDGYIAEIMRLEERDERRDRWHKKVMELYYKVRRWAQELAVITATNHHHGKEIQENVAEYIGKLEKIGMDADDVVREIRKESKDDKELLEG